MSISANTSNTIIRVPQFKDNLSLGKANLHYIFGLNCSVTSNVHFHDEQNIVYPAGNNCVMLNADSKLQKFIPATDKHEGITTLAISPNRRYIAIAEKGEKAIITIYDLILLRKKKVLTSSEMQSQEYVSLSFSPDSKCILAQGGKPDWALLYWSWEKLKVNAVYKVVNPPPTQVNQVSFSPKDTRLVCAVGNAVFRPMKFSEGSLKPLAYYKAEPLNYTCHVWLSDDKIIAGTDSGSLLFFEGGEVKQEIKMATADNNYDSSKASIICIAAMSNGFVCSFGPGTVYHFEKEDETFQLMKRIKIPLAPHSSGVLQSKVEEYILSLALSPTEEILAATSNRNQLYCITFSQVDATKDQEVSDVYFEALAQEFHHDEVTGLDVCVRKPLVATCSLDCSVKIWNYETCTLEVHKVFDEQAYSVALHPSGLFILVGFNGKLRLMNIFINDLKLFREFPVKSCEECAFSNGGHLFASVIGNVIQLFSTYSFRNTINLKGHNGKVKSVVWSPDDSKLVSCGKDGAVYEWDTFSGKRIAESILKTCAYSGVTINADGRITIAVGSDNVVKEISDSRILREVETKDLILTTIAMSHSGRMLFAGTTKGTLVSVKYPLTIAEDWSEFQGHSSAIVRIKIGYSDNYLLSTAEDGTVIIWKIFDKEGGDFAKDPDFAYAGEILISKKDLIEKINAMDELNSNMEAVRAEGLYQIEQRNILFNEKLTKLTERFITEMECIKTKYQVLKNEKEEDTNNFEAEVQRLIQEQTIKLGEIEDVNDQKLVENFEKFNQQQARFVIMQEDYEKQLGELEESKEKALEGLTDYYEKKLEELMEKLTQCQAEGRLMQKDVQETIRQIELDTDREILDIKHSYSKKLAEEKRLNIILKGDNGILNKRFDTLNKEIMDFKEDIRKLQTENTRLSNTKKELDKDIFALKKDVAERDGNLEAKEEYIYLLKRKNQQLEKFKFVLDYKIKELRKQIEPREIDIKKMKEQIEGMELELGKFLKQIIQLDLTIAELKQKLKATEKEVHQEKQKVRDTSAVVRRFKTELYNCMEYIQSPKIFKDSIRALYQRNVIVDITEVSSFDADIQIEFTRQKEHLERSVATLRKKLIKDSEIHRVDVVKIMQENVTLIKEISDLRKELKLSRDLIHDLSSVIAIESQRKTKPMEAIAKKGLTPLLQNDMEEQKKIIEMQQVELKRLRDENYDLMISSGSRRPSHVPSFSLLS